MPAVRRILIENAPSTTILQQGATSTTAADAGHLVDKFRSEFEAGREQEAPLTKAERAESNLRKLVEMLRRQRIDDARQIDKVAHSLTESESLINSALRILQQRDS